jgi:hypothetical protein
MQVRLKRQHSDNATLAIARRHPPLDAAEYRGEAVCGGGTITATDCAVVAGIADEALAKVSPFQPAAVLGGSRPTVEDPIDRMKTEARDETLIVVGGAFLVPDHVAGLPR